MKLWKKVTLGLLLGIAWGVYLPEYVGLLKPLGESFLRIIKMVIVPLIYFSLVVGITSMKDPSSLGRIGVKAIGAFLTTTFFAVIFGIGVATILKPGYGVTLNFDRNTPNPVTPNEFDLVKFFVNIVPENVMHAFSNAAILQVVFFAIFTGITINKMGKNAAPIKDLFQSISKLVFKMIAMIITLSPYGAFALTAWIIGTQGITILFALSKLVIAIIVAMTLQYLIFGVLIIVCCRVSPMPFYRKSLVYQLLAFSTSSSKATLATTMQVAQEKLGISETSTSFVLPLGASINMDGFAINLGLSAIFFAQMLGVALTPHDYLMIIITATFGSIGGAGIPGASMIMLPMVLSSVGLPIEGVALLAGIDRILDMLRTTINITGDVTITMIVDHSEKNFNKEIYYSK